MSNVFDASHKVFLVTKGGYDVESATPEDFNLHSGFQYHGVPDSLEGYESYTTPSTISSGETVAKEITHSLGYLPDFQVFVEDIDGGPDTFAHIPFRYTSTSFSIIAKVSTTKLYILLKNIGGDITDTFVNRDYGFRYQIFNTGVIPE